MKPLAAPVLGGMVSSLLHVLVVTPVIFYWLRERRLRGTAEPQPTRREGDAATRREEPSLEGQDVTEEERGKEGAK